MKSVNTTHLSVRERLLYHQLHPLKLGLILTAVASLASTFRAPVVAFCLGGDVGSLDPDERLARRLPVEA
jgi:hypothetical protein